MTPRTESLIRQFYPADPQLHQLLFTHSRCVAELALDIAARHPELHADTQFIEEAARLHDIGIGRCDAPGIFCHGELPYICHGVEGARILAEAGLLRHARVCERHTGSGLTAAEIEAQALPLPHRDMLPVSIEEKIICYADKFFSKNPDSLTRRKSLDEVLKDIERHGKEPLSRFLCLHNLLK